MSYPRVFVSSTCYDLGQVRDDLVSFIKSYHFEPILSERGDVFYHPDLHTHESCISEIGKCDLFILIIGGRFGGNYISDTKKSIVNAEYLSARESDIPVFTFIKREVYDDHRVYNKNKKNEEIIGKIEFPSIEKQEYASKIFQFIDDVRYSKVNNGLFSFEFSKDIEDTLRKQWAGMFCEYLTKRRQQKQFEITTNLLSSLSIASQKTEEIIKNMYKHLDEINAEKVINEINYEADVKKLFSALITRFQLNSISFKNIDDAVNFKKGGTWLEFILSNINGFHLSNNVEWLDDDNQEHCSDILWGPTGIGMNVSGKVRKLNQEFINNCSTYFESYLKLSPEQRRKVITSSSDVD